MASLRTFLYSGVAALGLVSGLAGVARQKDYLYQNYSRFRLYTKECF